MSEMEDYFQRVVSLLSIYLEEEDPCGSNLLPVTSAVIEKKQLKDQVAKIAYNLGSRQQIVKINKQVTLLELGIEQAETSQFTRFFHQFVEMNQLMQLQHLLSVVLPPYQNTVLIRPLEDKIEAIEEKLRNCELEDDPDDLMKEQGKLRQQIKMK